MLIFLITAVLLTGCNDKLKPGQANNIQGNAAVSNNTAGIQSDNNSITNTYINVKYFFRISYPKAWTEIVESETQDGALLYYKDDNDVRAFADKVQGAYIEAQKEQAKAEGKNVSEIVSNDGLKGILITGNEKGKKLTHVIYVSNGTHYDFYASVKDDFYNKNGNTFIEIGKSIKLLSAN